MVISGSLTIPRKTYCWHYETHGGIDYHFGFNFYERFDIGECWLDCSLGKWGFKLTFTRINEEY